MLKSIGLQRVGHDWETEQQQELLYNVYNVKIFKIAYK